MAYTLSQLQAIEAAIATGELTVEYDGKKVTYRSMVELIQARDLIRGELAATGQLSEQSRISYTQFSRE
jgi:hypothetical protein